MAPSRRRPVSLKPIDLGNQHGCGLAEHDRFGLDAADAPAQHRQAVDHGGVTVGAHQRIRIGDGLLLSLGVLDLGAPHGLRQMLQVHLVADAGARWHDAEIVERLLAPAQKRVALAVALIFEADILGERLLVAEVVHHDRVVDHQIHRRQRVDHLDDAEQARHPADRGREQHDHDERDDRAPHDLEVVGELVPDHVAPHWRYFVPYRRSPASPRPGTM